LLDRGPLLRDPSSQIKREENKNFIHVPFLLGFVCACIVLTGKKSGRSVMQRGFFTLTQIWGPGSLDILDQGRARVSCNNWIPVDFDVTRLYLFRKDSILIDDAVIRIAGREGIESSWTKASIRMGCWQQAKKGFVILKPFVKEHGEKCD
jgi:hypothetical protein